MKVYELMSALAELPSGADVFCTAALMLNEVECGTLLDDTDDEIDMWLYEVSKPLDSLDNNGNRVYLGF